MCVMYLLLYSVAFRGFSTHYLRFTGVILKHLGPFLLLKCIKVDKTWRFKTETFNSLGVLKCSYLHVSNILSFAPFKIQYSLTKYILPKIFLPFFMVTLMGIAHNDETGQKKQNSFIRGCTTGSFSSHPAFEDAIFIKVANFSYQYINTGGHAV
jgi:hypothetical protein